MKQGAAREYMKGYGRRNGGRFYSLDNFLTSKLGKHWDDIYSEMCEAFHKDSYARSRMVREALGGYYWKTVTTDCWIGAESGIVYDFIGRRVNGLYIHPWTGILSYQERTSRAIGPQKLANEIEVTKTFRYTKIDGIWYAAQYQVNEYYAPRYANYHTEHDAYCACRPYTMIHDTKRQLSKKDLRTLKLQNGPENARKSI